jgi:hypothetical protein
MTQVSSVHPSSDEAAPVRVAEQELSAKIVGVDDVAFLGYRDGIVEYSTALRRDLEPQHPRTPANRLARQRA